MQEKAYTNLSFVYDRERRSFVHMNDSFAQFLKREPASITTDVLLSVVHPDDLGYVDEKLQEALIGSFNGFLEFRVIVADEVYWVRVTPFLLNIEERSLIGANVIDFTPEWKNSDAIRKYANKKNSILNMLSHDLRGPLDIANSLSKSIERKANDPVLLKMSKSISGILNQSIQLIADLIDRELVDTVEVELSLERMDIARKVTEYIEECKKSESSIDREFNLSVSAKKIYMELDEAKFMQIMNNLITNALKFTHPGGVISIRIQEQEDSVLFSIADNGIGIPANLHEALFDKFTKARRKGLNGEPTLGLGLSIVKTIIEWHKGKIWFESEEQVGTTFYFEIPKGGR